MLIFSCAFTSPIRGVRIQEEQSRVGNVLSSCDILPPILGVFSTISTSYPASAISRAVWIPAIPPPMIRALFVTRLSPGWRGVFKFTFAIAALARITAFFVASSISTMYGFRPALSAAFLNVASCIRGEHEQTTTPVRFFSLMASWILAWPASEHMYW